MFRWTLGLSRENAALASGAIRRLFSAFVWAAVLYEFRKSYPLQESLSQSMRYLHSDSALDNKKGWTKNLGRGAEMVPWIAVVVWMAKFVKDRYLPIEEGFVRRPTLPKRTLSFIDNVL